MNLRLLVVQGRPAGKALIFAPGEYYLGRGEECHVRFNSEIVSRQHCELHVREDHATLKDLGSRNGTLVNGQLVREHTLHDGDQVQIGAVVFAVRLEHAVAEAPAAPAHEVIRSGEQDSSDEVSLNSTAHLPALDPKEINGQGPPA
jgi:pSer/pThr/pTyr-binding forkhead associated (FHA) protein